MKTIIIKPESDNKVTNKELKKILAAANYLHAVTGFEVRTENFDSTTE